MTLREEHCTLNVSCPVPAFQRNKMHLQITYVVQTILHGDLLQMVKRNDNVNNSISFFIQSLRFNYKDNNKQ